MESNKALTAVGIVINHTVVHFSNSYYVHTSEFEHGHDRSKEGVKYGTTDRSKANLTVTPSKLLSYTLAQLIWCSYIY